MTPATTTETSSTAQPAATDPTPQAGALSTPKPVLLPTEPIPLRFPFTRPDGVQITSITLRPATVKQLRGMKRFGPDAADQELGTVAELAGLIPEDLDMVDARDYANVQKSFRQLMGGDS